MEPIELDEGAWAGFLDALSVDAAGAGTSVQVARRGGDSLAVAPATLRPLHAIRYDRERRALEVAVGGAEAARPALRCFVVDPRRLLAAESEHARTILIIDAGGTGTLIRIVVRPGGSRRPGGPFGSRRGALRSRGECHPRARGLVR